jgi:hypothetical protein
MKVYTANAISDWGAIYYDRSIKAGSFRAAFTRAASAAQQECRRRSKDISIKIGFVAFLKWGARESTPTIV